MLLSLKVHTSLFLFLIRSNITQLSDMILKREPIRWTCSIYCSVNYWSAVTPYQVHHASFALFIILCIFYNIVGLISDQNSSVSRSVLHSSSMFCMFLFLLHFLCLFGCQGRCEVSDSFTHIIYAYVIMDIFQFLCNKTANRTTIFLLILK